MPILGVIDSGKSGHLAPPNSYASIATQIISSAVSSVSFTSIPQTYTHLQIRATVGASSGEMNAWLNSDFTGSNYIRHLIYGSGGSYAADGNYPNPAIGGYYGTGSWIQDILDYTNTNKNKVSRTFWGYDSNGGGTISVYSYAWLNTSAINTITYQRTSGDIPANTIISLYGVK